MLYKAYHRLLTADGITIEGPVTVRCDRQGKPAGWHLLEHEEPHTIWEGGTLQLDLPYQDVLLLQEDKQRTRKGQVTHSTKEYNT